MVFHDNLTIALHGNLGQSLALAPPARLHAEFVERYLLLAGVTGEDVVDAKGFVGKVLVEVLGHAVRRKECKEQQKIE